MNMESHDGMILTGVNRIPRRKTYPSTTLSTTNPTWTDPDVNPGLREWLVTNRLSHSTATKNDGKSTCDWYFIWLPEPNILHSTHTSPCILVRVWHGLRTSVWSPAHSRYCDQFYLVPWHPSSEVYTQCVTARRSVKHRGVVSIHKVCLRSEDAHNLCNQPYGSKSLLRSTGSAVWNF
jgi:hypothetical protein